MTKYKNNFKSWLITYTFFSLILALLISCKARNVNKDYEKNIDKTEQKVTVVKKDSTDIKTKDSSTETKITTVKEDTETGETEITTITYFKPDSVTPANSIKEIRTEKNRKAINKGTSIIDENKASERTEKTRQVNISDSTGTTNNDKKNIVKSKEIETKDNTIKVWVGLGFFVAIITIIILVYRRFKNGW